jgi:hypothetical protein
MTRRATVLVLPGIPVLKQEKAALGFFLAQRRLAWVSLTGDPHAVVALIVAHVIDVVVCCVDTRLTDELVPCVEAAGGRLEVIRRDPHHQARTDRQEQAIRQAAARSGASPDVVASVLGIEVEAVLKALKRLPVPAAADVERSWRAWSPTVN